MTIKKAALIIGALLFTSTAILFVLIACIDYEVLGDSQAKVYLELVKSLLQLTTVILIGGAITAVYKALESSRSDAKEKEAAVLETNKLKQSIRIDYLLRLGKSYRAAKGTRRALRAAGLSTKYCYPEKELIEGQLEIYKEQMRILNQAQLELEELKIEATSLPSLLGLGELPNLLASMEKYLRNVVKEYEKVSSQIIVESKPIRLALPDLPW